MRPESIARRCSSWNSRCPAKSREDRIVISRYEEQWDPREMRQTTVYRRSRTNPIGHRTHHIRLHHRHHLRPTAFSHKCPVNRSARSGFLAQQLPRGTVRSSLRATRDVRDFGRAPLPATFSCSKINSTCCQHRGSFSP